MKIGIICFWDRIATPYLTKYEKILEENKIEYQTILWNRGNVIKSYDDDIIINQKIVKRKILKIISFLKWRRKIITIIKKEKYDKLIILTTVPALFLMRFLIKNYSGKYIFDIRDYTFEKNSFFRSLTMKIIDNSFFSTISSKGFYQWLEKRSNIIPNHNLTYNENLFSHGPDFTTPTIEFGFVGNVRLDKQTKDTLIKLNKSMKIVSTFYGRIIPSSDTLDFIKQSKITNIKLLGEFSVEQKPSIYKNIHLINAIYANTNDRRNYGDSTPLPNRIYDCVVFKRPIVASKNTFLADLVEKYNLGVTVNGSTDDVETILLNYLSSFDEDQFIEGCNQFYNEIIKEEKQFLLELEKFIKIG